MARVKLDEILDEHESDIRRAMGDILRRYAPDHKDSVSLVTRAFIRAVDRHTSQWTRVRESYVEPD